ncbi:hypothetical protein DFQ14_103121 [Halopolyspora algeriensis]|uniref:Excreted virulence factor EspC (Type VII ESX diderm) n=1 Tax=Halopolyspora algeriensis TaxID=1500506 RepID=A0A368VY45_9ACTN|nr:hypothetical protein [Halopolyspora algeriensis]RCW45157.1 hypothetical protein DFQ14_103121 [Halopolyspora algeriensis]TQM53124.1 hypothetical protein FHU43_2503 [Halopolyspora algeriensis]
MSDFTVDIGGLEAMEKNLDRAKDNLGSALKAMEDIGPDSIGPDSLDEACAQFREDWQRGIGEIGECVDKITTGLGQAKNQYQQLESALQDGFAKMHEAVESGRAGMAEPPVAKPAPAGGVQ